MYYLWRLCKRYWIWIGALSVCLGSLALLLGLLYWPH